jgi:hypothetical protein
LSLVAWVVAISSSASHDEWNWSVGLSQDGDCLSGDCCPPGGDDDTSGAAAGDMRGDGDRHCHRGGDFRSRSTLSGSQGAEGKCGIRPFSGSSGHSADRGNVRPRRWRDGQVREAALRQSLGASMSAAVVYVSSSRDGRSPASAVPS